MLDCLFVGIGGFIGTVCRYLIGLLPIKIENGFPVKTLCINVVGAFVISLITAWAARNKALDARIVLMLKVGVCGGFTTFSTFAYESADLLKKGNSIVAIGYMGASMVLSILAVMAAEICVR